LPAERARGDGDFLRSITEAVLQILPRPAAAGLSCGDGSIARRSMETDVEGLIGGVSTRRVDELVQAMGLSGISKSTVSKLCKEIDARERRSREGVPRAPDRGVGLGSPTRG
jgi:hypothetical protein